MRESFLATPALLKDDIEKFNSRVTIKGTPRWLAKQEKLLNVNQLPPARRYASIVFAVESVEEKKRLLRERALSIAGQRVYLADYHESLPTTQCNKCYKLGHNRLACREEKGCKYCLSSHLSKDHTGCKDCKVSGRLCSHQKPICRNCKGEHTATSSNCSLLAKA